MQTIFDRFEKKDPRYPTRFIGLIDRLARKRAFDTSIGTEEEKYSQGKIFANYYECFIYATVLGIRKEYRIPFSRATEGAKFLPIESWRPRQMVEYIFMSLLVLSDINFADLEELDEKEIDDKALDLVRLMEEYANGGFDLMQSKLTEEPQLFEDPYGAVGFLNSL